MKGWGFWNGNDGCWSARLWSSGTVSVVKSKHMYLVLCVASRFEDCRLLLHGCI